MPDEIALTPTSYIVLGLLSLSGQTTPYTLQQMISATVGHIWSLPNSQLYAEPARLARGGYLTERQETTGRRRKLYTLTDRGRAAFQDWLALPTSELYSLRDLALLKLYFGADPQTLADAQLDVHRQRLAAYEAFYEQLTESPLSSGVRLALDLGIRHERETVTFWEEHTRPEKST